jgi:NAD(P)-dependent dehydrogenase (short-subunit alcohol dehydrogenase family)
MVGRLQGRTAIITGSGSGIGRATALRFSQEDAYVVVCDLNADAAAETVRLLAEAGGEGEAVPGDVCDEQFVADLVRGVAHRRGRLDVMHNNAGNSVARGPLLTVTAEAWRRDIDLNLNAMFYGVQAALSVMVPQGGGSIINTSSGAGWGAVAGTAAYGSAKAGVILLTRTAALEYAATGVRVNALVPGSIRTPAFATALSDEDLLAAYSRQIPMGRLGEPADVANAALFLASDESSYVTGVALPVDGGCSGCLMTPKLDLAAP